MLRAGKLDRDLSFVLVIDVQEKLLPLIDRQDGVVRATGKLLDGAAVFNLPPTPDQSLATREGA